MFFDGSARMWPKGKVIIGVGVFFISTKHYVLPYVYSLTKSCSNNIAKYNALIIGL